MELNSVKMKSDSGAFTNVLDRLARLASERPEVNLKDVRLSADLMGRFVQGEMLNFVVLTLYPEHEGYTLALKIRDALENETAPIPYKEDELLKCIDNQQLPAVLIELLDEVGAEVFYGGCVFLEVRDYRSPTHNSWHILLKPTYQSILTDVQLMGSEQGWGPEELLQVESIVCMAVAEPLCLSPNPCLGELAVNRDRVSKQMNSVELRRARANLSSSCRTNRKRKVSDGVHSSHFRLHDFLERKSRLGKPIPPILKAREEAVTLTAESSAPMDAVDVLRLAKAVERPKETNDCSIMTCEEYLYETDRINGRVYLVRLTILQRPATEEFLGQLYVDRDYREGTLTGGASCMFSLGCRANVNRYIQQFTEIFTEEGRKSVKITHQVQNHPPRVMFTQSMREKERLKEKEEQQQQLQSQQQQQQPTGQVVPGESQSVVPSSEQTAPLTKSALLESLKSGQVTPAIATLVTLLSSAQQQQQQQNRPTLPSSVNGQQHQQQQSLLKPTNVRIPNSLPAVQMLSPAQPVLSAPTAVNPVNQTKPGQRPTALATLLTTSKVSVMQNSSPNKAKTDPPIRPATTAAVLPSYSQAISQSTATIVRAVRPTGSLVPTTTTLTSTNTEGQRFSLTVPALSALLAGTPSADSPSTTNVPPANASLPSLLERLQQQQSPGKTLINNNNNNQIKVVAPASNTFSVQSVNLASIQGAVTTLPTLQGIQVSIAGLSSPIPLASMAVTSSPGVATVLTKSSPVVRLTTLPGNNNNNNSVLQQQQVASSVVTPVQLVGAATAPVVVGTKAAGPVKQLVTASSQRADQSPRPASSAAQQQLRMALQRQVQLQLQQKMTTKQKNKNS